MKSDPIVAEIRTVRERIAAECDYDFHKMCERGASILRQWPGKVVTKEELGRGRVFPFLPNKQ